MEPRNDAPSTPEGFVPPEHFSPERASALQLVLSMDPEETVALYSREAEVNSSLSDYLTDALPTVADYDPPRLGEIMVGLAESPKPDDRKLSLYHIHALTPVDRELGVRLWDQLMRDEDRDVRSFAYQTLSELFACTNGEGQEVAITWLGITWKDAFNLAFSHAEFDGSTMHRIGPAALGQTVERPGDQA